MLSRNNFVIIAKAINRPLFSSSHRPLNPPLRVPIFPPSPEYLGIWIKGISHGHLDPSLFQYFTPVASTLGCLLGFCCAGSCKHEQIRDLIRNEKSTVVHPGDRIYHLFTLANVMGTLWVGLSDRGWSRGFGSFLKFPKDLDSIARQSGSCGYLNPALVAERAWIEVPQVPYSTSTVLCCSVVLGIELLTL